MAYDEVLADRIRSAIGARKAVTEKKMFGGVAFMLDGHMFCGVIKDDLMVRVGPEQHDAALRRAHARPMEFTGRPMKGYIYVARPGTKTVKAIAAWIERGADFVSTLEKKKK